MGFEIKKSQIKNLGIYNQSHRECKIKDNRKGIKI